MLGMPEEGDSVPFDGASEMKKTQLVALKNKEIIELMRVFLDCDAEGILDYLTTQNLSEIWNFPEYISTESLTEL